MSGVIRTYQKCPACKNKFPSSKGSVPIVCSNGCQTQPTKFFIKLKWKGNQYAIYRDRSGRTVHSWEHASRLLAAIRTEIDSGIFDPDIYRKQSGSTFEAFWLRFLDRYPRDESTRDKVETIGRLHFDSLFAFQMRDIRAFHVDEWWNDLKGKGLSPKYSNDCLQWLKRFFNVAKALEIIERVPNFPDPLAVPDTEIDWISEEDQLKVLRRIPKHDRPIFDFLFLTGCRVMESAGLQRSDVDYKKALVVLRHTIKRNGELGFTKTRKKRVIPLVDEIKACLELAVPNLTGYVFVNKWGRRYSHEYLRSTWHQACQAAGVEPIKLKNATRHSFGMKLITQGVDMWRVSKTMGHSSERMTENYVEMLADEMKEMYGRRTKRGQNKKRSL
jgi:integrase